MPSASDNRLRVRGLTKTYRMHERDVHALRGVDLEIPRGQVCFILGRSGSGKSTLLHLLGALDRPTQGLVEVDGTDLGTLGEPALSHFRRDRIGFVFQAFNLVPNLTARENVLIPSLPKGISTHELRRATERLQQVGLGDRSDHLPRQLSGGEQQRVAIARAIHKDPFVLLADEPTGELDSTTGGEIMAILRELNRSQGMTLVIVTHDTTYLTSTDRVVQMADGRVRSDTAAPAPRSD